MRLTTTVTCPKCAGEAQVSTALFNGQQKVGCAACLQIFSLPNINSANKGNKNVASVADKILK